MSLSPACLLTGARSPTRLVVAGVRFPLTRSAFVDGVFTSRFAGQVARRFRLADGEAGALYTLGRAPLTGQSCPVVLYVAVFPPASPQPGLHDFGSDYWQQPVASAEEAARLLADFGLAEATRFRANCRRPSAAAALTS